MSAHTPPATGRRPYERVPLLALGIIALATGVWGGLLRLGWPLPATPVDWVLIHGPLMISGFLGTVIGLERAVGLRRAWAYLGPALTGLGGLALILGAPGPLPAGLLTLGSAVLVGVFAVVLLLEPTLYSVTMGLGAVAWLVGNLLWQAGWPVFHLVLWWGGFLVLTIVGERLELSRVLQPSPWARAAFLTALGLFLAGLLLSLAVDRAGLRLAGLGMIALAAWLWRYDIARRTVRQAGLTRFMAICLLSGYFWLAAAGLQGLLAAPALPGPAYDALLHMLFLGFVFTMIFGHAPVIFPAVLQVRMRFHHGFYGHLALLHASLLLRVAGDLAGWPEARIWGGLFNALSLLLFLVVTVTALWLGQRPDAAAARSA